MAGPGGGPPRKSHTKSRKGCATCKKRHIRCDESYPQCLNCTKHSCRCDYRDNLSYSNEPVAPPGPGLLWTPSIEGAVDHWHLSGVFPFPSMGLRSGRQFQGLSRVELRLVYHLLGIHQDMQRLDLTQCTVWVQELPRILDAAEGHSFVMNSVLAFAATHLAWLTDSMETKNLAYYHHGVALKGLHDAIGNFSRESSDAILAASILLSWQTTDWSGWSSLMQGISTILSSMAPWLETSIFASFITAHPGFFSPCSLVQFSPFMDDQALLSAINGLQRLSTRLARHSTVAEPLREMLEFAQAVQSYSASMQCEAIFIKLQPLRAWLFWTPITLSSSPGIRASDLVLLAQLYTVALAVDISLPELRGAALGYLTAECINQIDHRLRFDPSFQLHRTTELDIEGVEEAMQFPRLIATRCRLESTPISYGYQRKGPLQHSPYGVEHPSIGSTPGTPGFPPGTPLGYPISFGSAPASPFLHYGLPASRRHSQLGEGSPRLREGSPFESQSSKGYSFEGDSPAYASSFHDDDLSVTFRGHSPSTYPGEKLYYGESPDKGKQGCIG